MSLASFSAVMADSGSEDSDDVDDNSDDAILADADSLLNATLPGNAGISPDSPLWGLERAIERINLAFTFNEEGKAKKRLEFARERLLEARAMAEKNDLKALEITREEHKKELSELRDMLHKIKKDNPRDELKADAEIEQELESQETAAGALAIKYQIKVRGNLTEEQKARLTALIESFRNQSIDVNIQIKAEKAKAKLKIRAKESLSEDQADEIEDETDVEVEANNTAHGKGAEAVATAFVKIAERAVDHAKEKVARLNQTLVINQTLNETGHMRPISSEALVKVQFHLNNATSLLDQAKTALAQKNYSEARNLALQARREAQNALIMSSGRASLNAEERLKISDELNEGIKDKLEKYMEMRKEMRERKDTIQQKINQTRQKIEDNRQRVVQRIEEHKDDAQQKITAINDRVEDEDEEEHEEKTNAAASVSSSGTGANDVSAAASLT